LKLPVVEGPRLGDGLLVAVLDDDDGRPGRGRAAVLLMLLAIAWVAGRIYKVGILMAGKRPTLPELWRWIRET